MIKYFFGLPRSGKTTLAVKLAIKYASKGIQVYTNIHIDHPYVDNGLIRYIPFDYIGKYDLDNAIIIIDEASLFADNRDFKSLPSYFKEYLFIHGHHKNDILFFAQGYNAVDKKIRDLTEELYWVYKSRLFPFISRYVRIPYGLGFASKSDSSEYGDVNEGYKEPHPVVKFFAPVLFRPRFYRYFDSWEAPKLRPLPPY